MTSIKKFAQVCQGGTRQILKVAILYYHFQPKNCIYTQFDGHAMVLLDYMGFAPTWLRQVSLPPCFTKPLDCAALLPNVLSATLAR